MGDIVKDMLKFAVAAAITVGVAIGAEIFAVEPAPDGTCGDLWDLLAEIESPTSLMIEASEACARELLEDVYDR